MKIKKILILLVLFCFVANAFITISCISKNKLDEYSVVKKNVHDDNDTIKNDLVSKEGIEKIKIGFSISQVTKVLGPGIVGDPPTVSLVYQGENGGKYEILFFEFRKLKNKVKPKKQVTGIYYSINKLQGYFLLPMDLRGKSWDEVIQ